MDDEPVCCFQITRDAVIVDTSELTIEQVVELLCRSIATE